MTDTLDTIEQACHHTDDPTGRYRDGIFDEALAALARVRDLLAAKDEALRFYADGDNWTQPTSFGTRIWDDDGEAQQDGGKIARAALAAARPSEGEKDE